MLTIEIPSFRNLALEHLALDFMDLSHSSSHLANESDHARRCP
jgi:hypothetical protein